MKPTIRRLVPAMTLLLAAMASPGAEQLYVLSGPLSSTLYEVDPLNGDILNAWSVTGAEALFGGLAADQAGVLYSIDGYNDGNSDRLFSIDRLSGAGMVIGETRYNWNFRCVCVHPPTDVLYGSTDNQLYTLDKSTGAATPVVSIAGTSLDQLTALAIAPDGSAYGTDIGDTGLFKINLTTGAAKHIGDIGDSGNWFGDLAFDHSGVLHGVRVNGGLYTIDTATATATLEFNISGNGLAFYYTATLALGDLNCDGSVNPFDIDPFVLALTNPDDYSAQFPDCNIMNADLNCDGLINPFDIDLFVQCLTTGDCDCS